MGDQSGNVPYEIQPDAIPSRPLPTYNPSFADMVLSAAQTIEYMKMTDIGGNRDGVMTVDDYTAEQAFTMASQPKPDLTMREGQEFLDELEKQKVNPDVQHMGSAAFELGKKSAGLHGPRTSFSIDEAAAQNINTLKTAFPDEMKKLNIDTDLSSSKPTEVLAKMAEVLARQQESGMEK